MSPDAMPRSESQSQMFTAQDPVMRMIGNFLAMPWPQPNRQIRMSKPLIFMQPGCIQLLCDSIRKSQTASEPKLHDIAIVCICARLYKTAL